MLKPFQSVIEELFKFSSNYAIGITGFLIAGFSILISIGNQGLFLKMAKAPSKISYNGRLLNQFQYLVYNFMTPIFWHFILVPVSLLLWLAAASGQPVHIFFSNFFGITVGAAMLINAVIFTTFSSFLLFCFLELKSLIWNVYSIMVLDVLIQDHESKAEKETEEKPTPS
jgi:hypothetical protein